MISANDVRVAGEMGNDEHRGEEASSPRTVQPPLSDALGDLDVAESEPSGVVIDVGEATPTVDLRDDADRGEADEDPEPTDRRDAAGDAGFARARDRFLGGPLTGKVAVVSGGGEGVGRAIALALLDSGARVCLLGRDAPSLRGTIELAGRTAPALYLQCDLGSVTEIESAADFIGRFDRPVDLLVHAAAVRVPHGMSGAIADLDEQYLVNLRGPYALTQKLMGSLSAGPGHVFLLDLSTGVDAPDVQHAAIMAGLRTMAEGIRNELSETGVRVTTVAVAPGTDDLDVARCVVASAEMPPEVEVSDVTIRVVRSAPQQSGDAPPR